MTLFSVTSDFCGEMGAAVCWVPPVDHMEGAYAGHFHMQGLI